jgi:hypothetical protein
MSCAQTTVIVRPKGASETRRREEAAHQVLSAFGALPAGRLLCYFDEQDCWAFKDGTLGLGKANRGLSGPVTKPTDFQGWPWEVVSCIYTSLSVDDSQAAFDFVTYLHDSSCEDPVGLTMTFAHELQHFIQWATMPTVWEANARFVKRRLESVAGFDSHELPVEKDARIVAKRIAIRIHGREAVDRCIEKNIANPMDDLDQRNWLFVKGLDVAKPFDVELETVLFGNDLKSEPLPLKTRRRHDSSNNGLTHA